MTHSFHGSKLYLSQDGIYYVSFYTVFIMHLDEQICQQAKSYSGNNLDSRPENLPNSPVILTISFQFCDAEFKILRGLCAFSKSFVQGTK